jgi:hypothetical protein
MREEMAQHKQQDKESYNQLEEELNTAKESISVKEEIYKKLL